MTGSCCADCGANIDTCMTYCEDCSNLKAFYFQAEGRVMAKSEAEAKDYLFEMMHNDDNIDIAKLLEIEEVEE